MNYGWTGRILKIDLSTMNTSCVKTFDYLSYIGGRGINQRILFESLNKDSDPLGSENMVILGAGPLVGTLIPGADRLAVDFKNAVNNGVGSGNCGGQFAAEMKFAGYDHIIISGKASKPVYVYIYNDNVFFRDATDIWGKDTWTTENIIKKREGDRYIKTLTIGQAGENLVKQACIIGDRGRAVGYGGGGAVFGSKNLKAIAIRGTLPIKVAHPQLLLQKLREFKNQVVEKSKTVKLYRKGGTLLPYLIPGENRPHGVRNMSEGFWSNEAIECVTREKFDRYLTRRHSCFNCPAYCSSIYNIGGLKVEGVQANTLRAMGSNVDVRSPKYILHANALLNMYGLDTDQTSATIAWAIECFENGILTAQDTDGIELSWGDGDSVIELINLIAFRKGFGNVLADGVYEACKVVGKNSEKYAVLVKKVCLMEAAMRSHKGWALGIVTSTKGGGHLRGAPSQEMQNVSPEMSRKLFYVGPINNPTSYENKPELVVWQEKYKGIVDMLGLCASMSMWQDITLFTLEDIVEMYAYTTGQFVSGDYLMKAGQRLQNLERLFNYIHAGFSRQNDMPPEKLVKIAVGDGPYKGEKLDLEKWNEMLDIYYSCHNWNKETGLPTKQTLKQLEMDDIITILEAKGVYLQ